MSIELIARLRAMKLHGMASAWPELAAKARQHELDPEQWFGELLAAECAEREVKSQANQMKAARFPAHRDLVGFDFAYSRVDEARPSGCVREVPQPVGRHALDQEAGGVDEL